MADLKEQYSDDMSAYTAEEFSSGSRWYWLTRTKAGLAIGYAAFLGLIVGMVITYQTLYSATAASATNGSSMWLYSRGSSPPPG